MKISLDLSREFAYDAGKVKEFKTKVRAPKGSGRGPEREKNLSAFHLLTKLIWTLCEGILDP